MTIDLNYIPEGGLTEYFVDKDTGEPLAAGIVKFWVDSNRVVSKDVYQITGAEPNYTFTSLGATLVLSSVGTFEDNLGNPVIPYYYPYDSNGDVELYYVTVESSGNIAQFTRSAWPHVDSTSVNPDVADELVAHNNLISNGTFVDVLFPEAYYTTPTSHIYTVTGSQVTSVAPGWDLVTSGAGTVTVSRVANTSIAPNDPAVVSVNPPYALRIIGSGGTLTTLTLRQRLEESPRLDANSYVSAYILAAANAGSEQLTVTYDPSGGTTVTLIAAVVGSGGQYEPFNSVEAIVAPFNTDSAITGYVDIIVGLESDCDITISCVQIVSVATSTIIGYNQQTTARERDFLSHYYMPQVQQKPIPSWLVGWDFPLNPSQFVGDGSVSLGAIGTNKGAYVWDQTIAFQTADNSIAVSREASKSFILGATTATQGAIIQYLDNTNGTVAALLHGSLAVNVYCKCNSSNIKCTVSLWYTTDTTLPNVGPVSSGGTNSTFINTLGSNGKPASVSGNWTEIPRINNLGDAIFTPNSSFSTSPLFQDYSFNGWSLEGVAAINNAAFVAIVIGTSSLIAGDNVVFESVGLMTGDVATRPAPQTPAQVLQDCQRYYESSYLVGTSPATTTATPGTPGMIISAQLSGQGTGAGNTAGYAGSFEIKYNEPKRLTPTVTFYSPVSGTSGNVYYFLFNDGAIADQNDAVLASFWTLASSSTKATYYKAANGTRFTALFGSAPDIPEAFISYHYTADSRLGIVN